MAGQTQPAEDAVADHQPLHHLDLQIWDCAKERLGRRNRAGGPLRTTFGNV
jgi:hypothetical protein